MGNLSELALRTSYHKGRDDIAEDFYLPSMRRAIEYDRAVGYFRSTAFSIAWPALRDFVLRSGKIRILCSHVLSVEDVDALEKGYAARLDEILATHFIYEVRSFLADSVMAAPARILSGLVAHGALDLKIAVLRETDVRSASGRIFHDKLGIFRDDHNNVVVFKGSMNETWSGLATAGNLESVDVAASWMGARDLERAMTEQSYFEDLWADRYPTLKVRPFPDVARDELKKIAPANWEAVLSELNEGLNETETLPSQRRMLRPHQAAGLASWNANSRQGILAFATGSGKTFTAITAIREAISVREEVALIVVPDRVLFKQWHGELEETMRDLNIQILRAGSGFDKWRDSLRLWTSPSGPRRLVLATVRTAASDAFRNLLAGGTHLFLVADEVHRLGSEKNKALLDERLFGARLGLSATPERANDPLGTATIVSFFRGILEPRYTLADAVRDGVLTRYFYRPHTLELTDDEVAEWRLISVQAARLHARISRGDQGADGDSLQRLFIQRARIVKRAKGKVPLAVQVLKKEYSTGQRWIVYCDDLSQLAEVSRALLAGGIENMPFHSQMSGDRDETLKWLDRRGGVVVAIKCLDEGVDIPSVTHALILASSKNPREFIQRRGRVLRTAPNKALAFVHDAIVIPPRSTSPDDDTNKDPITAGELARAVEFAQHADNPAAAADLQQIAISAGIDWRSLQESGIEDEDD